MREQLMMMFLLLSSASPNQSNAQCTSTSLKTPGSAHDFDAHNGTDEANWMHADGVQASTNLCILGGCAVSAQLTSILSVGDKNTENLVAQDFSINLPATAVVCGIGIVVRKHAIGLNDRVSDVSVKLRKNGIVVGSNKKKSGTWGSALSSYTYGGSNDLWGTTWTVADINAANFGIEFVANVDYTFSLSQLLALDISLLPQAHLENIGVIVYYVNPLPVEMIQFNGEYVNNQVDLKWATGSESNNYYYVIERSGDAERFDAIGTVDGTGNSSKEVNYEYTDESPLPGISYYRLVQTDFNGVTETFEPISVKCNASKYFSVFPNPVSDVFMLQFTPEPVSIYSFSVKDAYGKEVERQEAIGLNQPFDTRHLSNGLYFVQLKENDKIVAVQKVVLE